MRDYPNEREIINLFVKTIGQPKPPYSKIGDDVAFLPVQKGRLVAKSDMLVRKTDVPKQMSLWQVARKSIVMCVSDFAAKGVTPQAALLSLGIPRGTTLEDVKELAQGFKKAKNEFSIEIVGGDTNEANDLIIDCSMFGFADKIVGRDGARPGDAVIVSNLFGYSAAGLKILSDNLNAKDIFKAKALSALLMPQPRLRLGIALCGHHIPTSAIDSSDGLSLSLYEIADQSNVRIDLTELPTAAGVTDFAQLNNLKVEDLVLYGGEEYEIVCTIPRDRLNLAYSTAKSNAANLIEIGKVVEGKPQILLHKDGIVEVERRGWIHLN